MNVNFWRGVHRTVFLVGIVVAALILGSVKPSWAYADTHYAPEPAIDDNSPSLAPFYHQHIQWINHCLKISIPLESDCAHINVPLDYAKPQGRQASIFVFRLKARNTANAHPGTVFFNPGGPGASGADYILNQAKKWAKNPVTENLNLIGFDPRGIGMSVPKVVCLTDREKDAERANDKPTTDVSQIAAECAQRTGPEVLAHVNSVDVARDLDVIRSAMGLSELNYVGKSYGTFIGQQYIDQFPSHVGSFILDGVVDQQEPSQALIASQEKGFAQVLEKFAINCANTVPGCPLGGPGTVSDKLAGNLHALIEPLKHTKAPTDDHRGLSFRDAVIGIHTAMYSPKLWPILVKALGQLKNNNGNLLLKLSDLYYQRGKNGQYSNMFDSNLAVICTDGPPTSAKSACNNWPVNYVLHSHAIRPPAKPIVVVSTTGDPATPYQNGVNLARQLHADLVTFRGTQHLATFKGNACIDGRLIKYLETGVHPGSYTC